jgi:hypothetical protein
MITSMNMLLGALLIVLALPLSAADCGRGLEAETEIDAERWALNENGTVSDLDNELMWKLCPEGLKGSRCREGRLEFLTWEKALERAEKSNFAGFADWRIPKFDELERLIEAGCLMPATNLALFPNTPSGWFWFDSAEAENSPRAGQLSFAFGEEFSASQRNVVNLRLVRDIPDEPEPPEPEPAEPEQPEAVEEAEAEEAEADPAPDQQPDAPAPADQTPDADNQDAQDANQPEPDMPEEDGDGDEDGVPAAAEADGAG